MYKRNLKLQQAKVYVDFSLDQINKYVQDKYLRFEQQNTI